MKLHKFTVYVFDHDDIGVEEITYHLDSVKYLTTAVFHNMTTDIGEWDDDHPLNKNSADQLTFDEYFK